MRAALPVMLGVVVLASAASAQDAIRFPDPQRYRLENGLEVVFDPVPGRRSVAVAISYHVGARDQPRGWTGLAHLAEHLMYEGSLHARGEGYFEHIERAGSIERNAATSPDSTDYYVEVPSEQLETVLFLESDRMAFVLPILDEGSVDEQRRVVAREHVERTELTARSVLWQRVMRSLYPEGHPYRHLNEDPADLEQIGLRHVQWFLQSWYQPANATLAISGGFDPARTTQMVERWFGPVRRSAPLPARVIPPRFELTSERRVIIETSIPTSELRVIWVTPAYGAPGDAELDVVADLLEDELRRRLVDRGAALDVSAMQASRALGSEFNVRIVALPGQRADAFLEQIDGALRALAAGVEERAVSRSVELWFDRLISRMESVSARASLLSHHYADGRPYTIAFDAQRYRGANARRVAAAARRFLPLDRRLVASLVATPRAPVEGRIVSERTIESQQQDPAVSR